jgi:hypothetical protein
MPGLSKYGPLLVVICLGILVQVLLIPLGCVSEPHETAVAFTNAYLKLDPSMATYLCDESKAVDDIDMVEQYVYDMTRQARNRGFGKSYAKSRLYHVLTHTTYLNDSEATVSIHAKTRTDINPIYALVAKIFYIGESHPFEETLKVVKVDNRWKVCGSPLSLHGNI